MVDGTYAGVRFWNDNQLDLINWVLKNNIPNPCRPETYHATLLYSRKHLPDYEPCGFLKEMKYAKFGGFAKFDFRLLGTKCLVMKLDSPYLTERHKCLMDVFGATYDFPEYIPHITLSYDVGDLDLDTLPPFTGAMGIVEEYSCDLDLSYKP